MRRTCSSRSVLARVIWMFTGNKYARWDKFLPVHRSRIAWHLADREVLLVPLRKPPGFVGHNPLAGAAYMLVFGLYFLAIATGLDDAWRERRRRIAASHGSRRSRRSSAACTSPAGFTTS